MSSLQKQLSAMRDKYVNLAMALYIAMGAHSDIGKDYSSKGRALSLLGFAHIANIAALLGIFDQEVLSAAGGRRNTVMLVGGLMSVPWLLWMDRMIDRRKSEAERDDLPLFELQQKHYRGAVSYLVASFALVAIVYFIRIVQTDNANP